MVPFEFFFILSAKCFAAIPFGVSGATTWLNFNLNSCEYALNDIETKN